MTAASATSIAEFREAAEGYTALIEQKDLAGDDLIIFLEAHLGRLYAAAVSLPMVRPDHSDDDAVGGGFHAAAMEALEGRLAFHRYWASSGASLEEIPAAPPTVSMFADDLSDIYADLRVGLDLVAHAGGAIPDDAVWHWSFAFRRHWGRHALNALSAIHTWRFGS